MGSGAPRRQVAIIDDVGLSTPYRKFPAINLEVPNVVDVSRCSNL